MHKFDGYSMSDHLKVLLYSSYTNNLTESRIASPTENGFTSSETKYNLFASSSGKVVINGYSHLLCS